jgi:hypothetical protein
MPPRILCGQPKNREILKILTKNQKHPAINSTFIIIIVIRSVIFIINYPPLPLWK